MVLRLIMQESYTPRKERKIDKEKDLINNNEIHDIHVTTINAKRMYYNQRIYISWSG